MGKGGRKCATREARLERGADRDLNEGPTSPKTGAALPRSAHTRVQGSSNAAIGGLLEMHPSCQNREVALKDADGPQGAGGLQDQGLR